MRQIRPGSEPGDSSVSTGVQAFVTVIVGVVTVGLGVVVGGLQLPQVLGEVTVGDGDATDGDQADMQPA